MKWNKLAVGMITFCLVVSAYAGTRTRWINGPANQGNLEYFDSDTPGTALLTIGDSNITAVLGGSTINTGDITSVEILDETIVAADIATGAVTTVEILDYTIASVDIATNGVTSTNLANNSVTAAKILNGTIDHSKINSASTPTFASQIVNGDMTGANGGTLDNNASNEWRATVLTGSGMPLAKLVLDTDLGGVVTGDESHEVDFRANDSASNKTDYARFIITIDDATNTTEDADFEIDTMVAGTLTTIAGFDAAGLTISQGTFNSTTNIGITTNWVVTTGQTLVVVGGIITGIQ